MYKDDQELFLENSSSSLNIKEYLHKYYASLPLFIISLIICVGAGILYTRYTTQKYLAETLILVKSNQNGNANSSSTDLIEEALNGGKPKVNLDNEIQLLRSASLMERVVSKNGFNISYYKQGRFLTTDLYQDVPFHLIAKTIYDSSKFFSVTVKTLTNEGGLLEYGPQSDTKTFKFSWYVPFTTEGKTFFLVPNGQIQKGNDVNCIATWSPVKQTIDEISGKLTISILDTKTSIIQLSILIENLKRGEDILNALAKEYNISDIEDRNHISENSIRFINDRLSIVSKELSGVEGNLENYQGENQIINMQTQSAQSFENTNNAAKELSDINIQQGVVNMITEYFNNPLSNDKLVPSLLGLNDPTLASLMTHYNELQLIKQKEAPSLASNSFVMKELDNQIHDVKGSILESLKNISKNLQFQENSLKQRNALTKQFLNSLPNKERNMQEIKRKQSITEGLYLYLLQKREETAISSTASNISNYKQISPADGYGPVTPNTKNIRIYSALLGLMLPIGLIYLKDLLNDKITSRDDITKRLMMPIIGDISHVPKKKIKGISVLDRDLVSEQFRILRTNLSFLLKKKDNNVILITSSISDEGKTFVNLNLATVLAIPGKKVALLEFDLRKPGICKSLGIENTKGLTNYLSGQITDLSELIVVTEDVPGLHIYPSGPIPPNPADLLLNKNFVQLFHELKQDYDYVVIDSPPAGLVSDAFLFGQYADVVLYVVRQRYTKKKQLEFLNDVVRLKKLNNIAIVFNDLKIGAKYGYYGYGYNDTYGYNAVDGKTKTEKKKVENLI